MGERFIIPPIEIDADGYPVVMAETPEQRETVRDELLKRLQVHSNGWSARPKTWKAGGKTFYGLIFERKF